MFGFTPEQIKEKEKYPEEWYQSVKQWRNDVASGVMQKSYPHITVVHESYCFINGINTFQLNAMIDRSQKEAKTNNNLCFGWVGGEFLPDWGEQE